MRRFFVKPEFLTRNSGIISGDLFRHIATVLRLKEGETMLLADGCGYEALASIEKIDRDGATVRLEQRRPASIDESPLPITLCQGLPKGEKMDLILQKATELGVSRIVPFNGERSVARLDGERLDKRIPRWERIVQEAARQSLSATIPAVGFHADLATLLRLEGGDLKLLLWEGEKEQRLRPLAATMARPASVSVIIGPEGGLSAREAALAVSAGYLPVTLGGRILRTETAGLAVVAILQYLWGDLG